jgi:hypothetical protein
MEIVEESGCSWCPLFSERLDRRLSDAWGQSSKVRKLRRTQSFSILRIIEFVKGGGT